MAGVVKVGGRSIGMDQEPAFWPDIDLYFKRDIGIAIDLVQSLADAGCIFLKAAVLHDPSIAIGGNHPVTYYNPASRDRISEPYAKVIERHALPLNDLSRILAHARNLGLTIVLSVYDVAGVEFAVAEGAAAIKLPSSNIVHQPLIEIATQTGLPVILDTGRSKWSEITRAVDWALAAGARGRLIVQHSPPGPPAGPAGFHMRMISEFQRSFNCPAGLSDHDAGTVMFPVAVALGASLIEKGLVADHQVNDIDIAHALPVSQVGAALELIRTSWLSLGRSRRPDEEVVPDPARMGLFAARRLGPGSTLDSTNVRFAFPRLEVGVESWPDVAGRRTRREIEAGEAIAFDDLEPT